MILHALFTFGYINWLMLSTIPKGGSYAGLFTVIFGFMLYNIILQETREWRRHWRNPVWYWLCRQLHWNPGISLGWRIRSRVKKLDQYTVEQGGVHV
jgi:hypothetical protein